MPNKITDNELIENIKWCMNPNNACADCPYYELRRSLDCVNSLFTDILDLINHQKAEIERLKADITIMVRGYVAGEKLIKTEAVKEFADLSIKRICEKVSAPTPSESYIVEKCNQVIYETYEEMVGENDENL